MGEDLKPKTNEQMTQQVARITEKLMKRAAKLDLPAHGSRISTNRLGESTAITARTPSETGSGVDVHTVEVASTNGAPFGKLNHDKGFRVTKRHDDWVENAWTHKSEPRTISTTGVEAKRHGDTEFGPGRHSPMTVMNFAENTPKSGMDSSSTHIENAPAEHRPASPQNVQQAAESLSAIRGSIAAAEIAQQQAAAQAPVERSA